jgi:hypothetical protein
MRELSLYSFDFISNFEKHTHTDMYTPEREEKRKAETRRGEGREVRRHGGENNLTIEIYFLMR